MQRAVSDVVEKLLDRKGLNGAGLATHCCSALHVCMGLSPHSQNLLCLFLCNFVSVLFVRVSAGAIFIFCGCVRFFFTSDSLLG